MRGRTDTSTPRRWNSPRGCGQRRRIANHCPGSLSDLGDRRERGGRAGAFFRSLEAHSGDYGTRERKKGRSSTRATDQAQVRRTARACLLSCLRINKPVTGLTARPDTGLVASVVRRPLPTKGAPQVVSHGLGVRPCLLPCSAHGLGVRPCLLPCSAVWNKGQDLTPRITCRWGNPRRLLSAAHYGRS